MLASRIMFVLMCAQEPMKELILLSWIHTDNLGVEEI
jgi:hypothetical protein